MSMVKVSASGIAIGSQKKEITAPVAIKKVNSDKALEFAERIFKKMLISCSAGAAIYKLEEDKDEYILSFCQLLIQKNVNSIQAAEAAINELQEKHTTYVPGPNEFVSMILRHQNGVINLPPVNIAYKEACMSIHDSTRYKWTHDAVREAASRTGHYNLKTKEKKDVFPEFKYYYELVIDEMTSGIKYVHTAQALPIFLEPIAVTKEEGIAAKQRGFQGLKDILTKGGNAGIASRTFN
jgi:hypothetical protein